MTAVAWVVIVAGVALALTVVVWFFTARKMPQSQPGREMIVDRPGDPAAESQRVDERGTLETGPTGPGRPPIDSV